MNFTQRFLSGLPWWTLLPLFGLGVLTLVFSMIVSNRLAGGIEYGAASTAVLKGAALLAVVTLINCFDCGIILAGPVWYFGLMGLFHLDFRETRTLTRVNWGMNLVWKLLIMALML